MRATIASEKAIQEQLAAEEKLRIAEQKAAKKDLEQQAAARQMQEDLIGAIAFSVVLSEGDEILVATPETLRQFKIREGVDEDHTMSQYFVDPDDQQRIIDILREQGGIDNHEVLMHDREGTRFWVAVSLRPLVYDGKNCWLNSIYNIDARKRMEQDLAAAKESAEGSLAKLKDAQQSLIHAEKMASLGQLTAGIAHEIKNPLNFVNNFSKLSAEMMDELVEVLAGPIAALDEEDRDDAEDLIETVKGNLLKIDEHGRRADSIVKNMLQHSREGTGDKQTANLNSLAEEAMNLAYHGARANDQSFNITLESELSPEVGEIQCIPQELQRVILNLCTNGMYEAAKNAAAGGEPPVLRVSSRAEGESYLVEVTDNGGGVPENLREKIFQPFFTTKPTGEGTGLGLSMSYDIVKQHGGELSLESETGKGTTFRIRLPKD
jgi:signal transduction histidine kinase